MHYVVTYSTFDNRVWTRHAATFEAANAAEAALAAQNYALSREEAEDATAFEVSAIEEYTAWAKRQR